MSFHFHVGRTWTGTRLEDDCPCGKGPCGLVDTHLIADGCEQHGIRRARTIRQSHLAADCSCLPVRSVDGEEPA
jgi:hypothetical protein